MKVKLVIWDLDDTLWHGTLAEGDDVKLNQRRAEIVRSLNRCGIVSAICSKNDSAMAQEKLQSFGLWDEFVFPRIAFVPKGGAVKQLIEHMQLRPVNVLFVDDNVHNLNEVKSLLPEINIIDSTLPECDALLGQILEENNDVSKSRVEEYRILQTKVDDWQRQPSVSNEEFLRSCDIHMAYAYRMDNLDFVERIEELVNRSNQLNYTKSRLKPGDITNVIVDILQYHTWSVFVSDKYGDYGLVGFMAVHHHTRKLLHFVLSCRVMHMGIEDALMSIALDMLKTWKDFQLDSSALAFPLPDMKPDWINTVRVTPELHSDIVAKQTLCPRPDVALRIMFRCQSAGIAHFSKYRDMFDFDNDFRAFGLHMMWSGEYEAQERSHPPFLVYGAGSDYEDRTWSEYATAFQGNVSMFIEGVRKFCTYFASRACKILVILPPENMPESKYRSDLKYTRERTISFNNVWRSFAEHFPFITLLDLSEFAEPGDMVDIDHFYAGFLQKLAQHVDAWYESVSHG